MEPDKGAPSGMAASNLSRLGVALRIRFEQYGDLKDLEQAVIAHRTAVDLLPLVDGRAAGALSNLAIALRMRFEQLGNRADICDALAALRAALDLIPDGHPDRPGILSMLGVTLLTESLTGPVEASDLDEAISFLAAAANVHPDGGPDAGVLSNLGVALRARFEHCGNRDDLDHAVAAFRTALDLVPEEHGGRVTVLSMLGSSLVIRARSGSADASDMDEAVSALATAARLTSDTSPFRAGILSDLGVARLTRFELIGEEIDIHDSISALEAAVAVLPGEGRDRPRLLSNLGVARRSRYELRGDPEDLIFAVRALEAAVDTGRSDDPLRPGWLSNLATALVRLFDATGNLSTIDRAIDLLHIAVNSNPVTHQDKPRQLSNLGIALRTRFQATNSHSDLDTAVSVLESAVRLTPSDTADRARWMRDLGVVLRARYDSAPTDANRETAILTLRAAAESDVVDPLVGCAAARAWGELATGMDAVAAYRVAVAHLLQIAPRWVRPEDATERLSSVSRVARDATAAFLDVGDVEGAMIIGEQSRAVAYSALLQTRSDLNALREIRPDLADRLVKALNVMSSFNSIGDADARRAASSEVDVVLQEVRGIPGWKRFFLSPELEELTREAAAGPIVVLNVSTSRCDALIVTTTGVDHVALPDLTEAEAIEAANQFLAATATLVADVPESRRLEADTTLQNLMRWLWDSATGPVMDHLGMSPRHDRDYQSWPRLWWIPTGPLSLLPLHASGHHVNPLEDHDAARPATPTRSFTVLDRVISSTVPTVGALARARRKRYLPGPPSALFVAMARTPVASNLPNVEPETVRCADLLVTALGANVTVLAEFPPGDGAPTREEVVDQLPRHSWAHFACHGATSLSRPWAAALLLSDHLKNAFTVSDLAELRLVRAEHLYLSACDTARTGVMNIDEPIQFAAVGLLAGYRHVIATLWSIADSSQVAEQYYRQATIADNDPAGALHATIHEQRAMQPASVHRWGPYMHSGS